MSRKPAPGVCSKCGRARVRPTPQQFERAHSFAATHHRPYVTVSGHEYETDTRRLVDVRCINHEEKDGELYG